MVSYILPLEKWRIVTKRNYTRFLFISNDNTFWFTIKIVSHSIHYMKSVRVILLSQGLKSFRKGGGSKKQFYILLDKEDERYLINLRLLLSLIDNFNLG